MIQRKLSGEILGTSNVRFLDLDNGYMGAFIL